MDTLSRIANLLFNYEMEDDDKDMEDDDKKEEDKKMDDDGMEDGDDEKSVVEKSSCSKKSSKDCEVAEALKSVVKYIKLLGDEVGELKESIKSSCKAKFDGEDETEGKIRSFRTKILNHLRKVSILS